MKDALIVFLKEPRPGAVKTRLAAHVGDEAAAALYRSLAEAVARQTLASDGAYDRIFFHSPADAGTRIAAWFPDETLLAQAEGDLGLRMQSAFDEVFSRGAPRAVIIGTDVPDLSAAQVRQALDALQEDDLVLGPARDGGYYLMALKRPSPALLDGIPWSTSRVLEVTRERADALGLRTRLLETMRDVDTLEDLRAEWVRVSPLVDAATRGAIEAALLRG